MKVHYYILLLLLNLNSCKAQENTKQNIMIPAIDNNFEKFNKVKFEKESLRGKRKEVTKELVIEEDIQSPGYAVQIYPNLSFFSVLKLFFENGNINLKGITFNNGSEYGIWYKFDENGKLIEEINTDLGFDFDWKKVVAYCEENKIPLTKGYETSGFQTTIYKEELNESKVWQITFQTAGDKLLEITLDGKTGKELNKKELEFINH